MYINNKINGFVFSFLYIIDEFFVERNSFDISINVCAYVYSLDILFKGYRKFFIFILQKEIMIIALKLQQNKNEKK